MAIVFFIIGLLLGFFISIFLKRKKRVGTLEVLFSEEDNPYLFLKLDKDLYSVASKRKVEMDVKIINIAQEKQ